MKHIVREIKKYHHIKVANAMDSLGWVWTKPKRRPTNVETMCIGIPKCDLIELLNLLRYRHGLCE